MSGLSNPAKPAIGIEIGDRHRIPFTRGLKSTAV